VIEKGTKEDGSLTMPAKIAVQELWNLVNNEDISIELETQIRKSSKKITAIMKTMEESAEKTSKGSKFWVEKELESMVK